MRLEFDKYFLVLDVTSWTLLLLYVRQVWRLNLGYLLCAGCLIKFSMACSKSFALSGFLA